MDAGTTAQPIDASPSNDCADPSSCPRGVVHRNCRPCRIRYIRNGPHYWASERAGRMTLAYRQQLIEEFGATWEHGHKQVKNATP
jgi:hypothetical protein